MLVAGYLNIENDRQPNKCRYYAMVWSEIYDQWICPIRGNDIKEIEEWLKDQRIECDYIIMGW